MEISPSLYMLEESSNDMERRADEMADDLLIRFRERVQLKMCLLSERGPEEPDNPIRLCPNIVIN